MSVWFTEYSDKPSGNPIIFQFLDREMPEEIPFGKEAALQKIKYPGGHQTNQIMGIYRSEVEWSGILFGQFFDENGVAHTAKYRSDLIDSMVGRPLRVGFPVDGQGPVPGIATKFAKDDSEFTGGFKGVYIIESYTPKIRNYLNIEYTIKLVPHERQEKIKPNQTANVRVKVLIPNLSYHLSNLEAASGKSGKGKGPLKGAPGMAKSNAGVLGKMTLPNVRPDVLKTGGDVAHGKI